MEQFPDGTEFFELEGLPLALVPHGDKGARLFGFDPDRRPLSSLCLKECVSIERERFDELLRFRRFLAGLEFGATASRRVS